jgi:hypothetical protein
MSYDKALEEFYGLPHVNSDDLDGSIDHLVYRAQHELDLYHEGEYEYIDLTMTKAQYSKLSKFISKWEGK